MPYSPLFQLPLVVAGGQGPIMPAADVRPIFPASLEADAFSYWDFGGNADSLIDLISGRQLTLAGASPAYNADSITLQGGGKNGLITDYNDAAAMTFCCVAQLQNVGNTNNIILFGSSTTSAGDGGGMAWLTGSATGGLATNMQTRPLANVAYPTNFTSAEVAANPWVFFAFSRSDTVARIIHIAGKASFTDGLVGVKTLASKKIGIGNCYYDTASFQFGFKIAEAIIFPGPKTSAELVDIAARSKVRMARKGIAIANI